MRRYVSNIDVSNVSLGEGSGESLTTGQHNVLLGANQWVLFVSVTNPLYEGQGQH